MTNTKTPRETNGQYAIAKMDVVCKCGKRLGEHMAAAPRDIDGECAGFKKARVQPT